ncbi:MAG: hypothetical protein KF905_13780 [Flavobacteriales bacterium]|nr:hypothetical protein [Flavobacteriales bacterium]
MKHFTHLAQLLALIALCSQFEAHAQAPRLWGMTPMGGANDRGTLFRVDADGTDFTVEYHFSELSGWGAEGTLCLADNGKLYGTTNLGGAGSIPAGTLFSFDPASSTFTKLVDFNNTNGGFGWGGMVATPEGPLYGATYAGGSSGGSIFRLDPASDTYTIVYNLVQATDGGSITSVLYRASDGKLYGCAAYGGLNNAGTLFSFDPSNNTYTKLHDLGGGLAGETPYGSLCDGGNGWFYGTTILGGTENKGTLFKYAPSSNTFVKLLDFTGTNGQSPWNAPIRVGADKLYGTAANGGPSNGNGVVYSITPSTDAYTIEYVFNVLEGGLLFGNVMLANDGQLYGMGGSGGTNFQGTIFRLDPATNAMTPLHSFNGPTDGYSPRGDLVVAGVATSVSEEGEIPAFSIAPNPSSGLVRIELKAAPETGARLRIADALGRTVYDAALRDRTHSLQLDGTPGLYLVTVESVHGLGTRRLVLE